MVEHLLTAYRVSSEMKISSVSRDDPASGDTPIRILVADDHPIVRTGLKTILTNHPGWNVCGEAKSGAEALELANQLCPDVVVMDLNMPGMSGLDALRAIKGRWPEVGVVILTLHFSEPLVREIIKSGARGYVMKSDADRDLVNAVAAVAAGNTYFTVQAGKIAAAEVVSRQAPTGAPPTITPSTLSDREREAVRTIAQTMRKLL
jgi:DNA-binding NarL/FixJ family response regulator